MMIMNAANSFPRKTIVLETGFVSNGTIVPLSNSPEMLFMTVTMAKRKNTRLPALKVAAKSGFLTYFEKSQVKLTLR